MAICGFMGRYWWAVALAAALTALLFSAYRRTLEGRRQWDRAMLEIPLFGELLRRYDMAKFARTLGALFDNGVPVLQSIEISGATVSNTAISGEIEHVLGRVRDGMPISEALKMTGEFPPLVINMLAVGEEGGRLGEVTNPVADAYDVEVERTVKALTALFEPLLIVIMGVIIGFLVISMLLPMLTLSAQVR